MKFFNTGNWRGRREGVSHSLFSRLFGPRRVETSLGVGGERGAKRLQNPHTHYIYTYTHSPSTIMEAVQDGSKSVLVQHLELGELKSPPFLFFPLPPLPFSWGLWVKTYTNIAYTHSLEYTHSLTHSLSLSLSLYPHFFIYIHAIKHLWSVDL